MFSTILGMDEFNLGELLTKSVFGKKQKAKERNGRTGSVNPKDCKWIKMTWINFELDSDSLIGGSAKLKK